MSRRSGLETKRRKKTSQLLEARGREGTEPTGKGITGRAGIALAAPNSIYGIVCGYYISMGVGGLWRIRSVTLSLMGFVRSGQILK